MAVQRRVNWVSQQRVDVPDIRSVESASSNDFDQLLQSYVLSNAEGYVLRGFDIVMTGAIGAASAGLQMNVASASLFHPFSKQSGTFFVVPAGTPVQILNSALNNQVSGAFTPSSQNFVGIEYTRSIDDSTAAQVYLWDPTINDETTSVIPRANILNFQVVIATGTWAPNVLPVAIVNTDAGNNVISIEDNRRLLFRLGTGGRTAPNPFYSYPWNAQAEGRTESPFISSSDAINPFHGGDKMLFTEKDWKDAVMTKFKEITGSAFWYSNGSSAIGGLNLTDIFFDAAASVLTMRGKFQHSAIIPGQLTWSGDLHLRSILGPLTYTVPAGTVTLNDGQVAYILLVRDQNFQASNTFTFTNGSPAVTATTLIANIFAGDWIRFFSDDISKWQQVLSVSGTNITLVNPYEGSTASGLALRAQGSYTMQVADPDGLPVTSDVYWIAKRDDNGLITATIAAPTTGAVRSGGITTFTTTAPHGIHPGQGIAVSGVTDTSFNGTYEVLTAPTGSTITVSNAGPDATSGNGTINGTATIYLHGIGEVSQGESTSDVSGAIEAIIQFIGSTGPSDTQPQYRSTNYVTQGIDLTDAIGQLDAQAGTGTTISEQDRNLKLVRGLVWSFTDASSGAGNIAVQAVNNNTLNVPANGGIARIGQSFTTTAAGNIDSAQFNLRYQSTPVSGNITFDLYADNAGTPGAFIASSAPYASSGLTGSFQLINLAFSPNILVANATKYHVIINDSAVTGGNLQAEGISPNTYAGGSQVFSSDSGGTWNTVPSLSFTFAIHSSGIAGGSLAWSADAAIQIPDLPEARNNIPAGSVSLASDGDVAYVEINRVAGSPANLSVLTSPIASLVADNNTLIIARRFGTSGIPAGTLVGSQPLANDSLRSFVLGTKLYNVDTSNNLNIYDITTTTPVFLGNVTLSGGTGVHCLYVSGTHAYVGHSTSVDVIDVSVPASPVSVGTVSLGVGNNPYQLDLVGTRLFVLSTDFTVGDVGLFWIVDVSVPTAPVVVGSNGLFSGNNPGPIKILGNTAYLSSGNRVNILDVTTNTPALQAPYLGVTFATALDGNGTVLYVADATAIRTFSVSSPFVLSPLGSVTLSFSADRISYNNNKVFGSAIGAQKIAWVDVTTPASPTILVDETTTASYPPRDIKADNNHAYTSVVGGSAGIAVYNITATLASSTVLVGSHSFLLRDGESKELDAGMSIQNRTAIGLSSEAQSSPAWQSALSAPLRTIPADTTPSFNATASMDTEIDKFFGQMRLKVPSVLSTRVLVTSSDVSMLTGELRSQKISSLLLDFSGAQIDFNTGVIYKEDGVTGLGVNFTPVSMAPGQYQWYSASIIPLTSTSDGKLSGQLLVLPGNGTGNTPALAQKAPFPSNGIPLGQVFVQQGPDVEVDHSGTGIGGGQALNSPSLWEAQGFSFGSPELINRIQVALNLTTGTAPTGNIVVQIRTDNAGQPSSTVLATSSPYNVAGLTTSYQNIDFLFPVPFSASASTVYWFVVNTAAVVFGTAAIQNELANSGYGIASQESGDSGATWSPVASFEMFSSIYSPGSIDAIAESNVVQLGIGSGSGSGSGDTTDFMTRFEIWHDAAPYALMTPAIFETDIDTQTASASTPFDYATNSYKLGIGQFWISTERLDPEFIAEGSNVPQAEVAIVFNRASIDPNPLVELSRDGGDNWSVVTMQRIGVTADAYRGELFFTDEPSQSTVATYDVSNADSVLTLDTAADQSIGQPFAPGVAETYIVRTITAYMNKLGTPVGSLFFRIVKDNAGLPGTTPGDIVYESSAISINALGAGNISVVNLAPDVVLAPATQYHLVFLTDAAYKASYSAGVNQLSVRIDASAPPVPDAEVFDGTTWTTSAGNKAVYLIEGNELDLRIRYTSSIVGAQLAAVGIMYSALQSALGGLKNREVFKFSGNDNLNTFTVTTFMPDPDLLMVFEAETGQVYVNGGFALQGQNIVFPPNTFNKPGDDITLIAVQNQGSAFDNSDRNAALLAANNLGSTDPSIDRSQNGRGIFLRRPDGTLREITIDNDDNIQIWSV